MERSPEIKEKTRKLLDFISTKFENDELDNESLVQIIELSGAYLNLQTISNYSRRFGLSYNGVKKNRNIKTIFNVKFVIDNE